PAAPGRWPPARLRGAGRGATVGWGGAAWTFLGQPGWQVCPSLYPAGRQAQRAIAAQPTHTPPVQPPNSVNPYCFSQVPVTQVCTRAALPGPVPVKSSQLPAPSRVQATRVPPVEPAAAAVVRLEITTARDRSARLNTST